MDARLYWLWMQGAIGPGSPKADGLLRAFGHPSVLWKAASLGRTADLKTEDGKGLDWFGLSETERKRLADPSLDRAEALLRQMKERGVWLLTPEDARYPSLLRGISGLPLALYGMGELPDWELTPPLAVAGTRKISDYGRQAAWLIAGGLALGGAAVVAGGAVGVEAAAHRAALEVGGLTVSVQAAGFDAQYPSQNRELREDILAASGTLLSEYPPDEPGRRLTHDDFLMCNRIVSGLSLGVCVIEAGEKSGSLMIARHARDQGRDVFAVAGNIVTGRSAGTDALIKQGARLADRPEEIIEEYLPRFPDILDREAAASIREHPAFRTLFAGREPLSPVQAPKPAPTERARKAWSRPETLGTQESEKEERVEKPEKPEQSSPPSAVSGEARRVWETLDEEPRLIGPLAEACGLPVPAVLIALTELEMQGAARRLPGQLYVRG